MSVKEAAKKRHAQFDPLTKYLSQYGTEAALAAFYDSKGAYRLAIVHTTVWQEKKKPLYSDHRRVSLLVEPGKSKKTFCRQMRRLLDLAESGRPLRLESLFFSTEKGRVVTGPKAVAAHKPFLIHQALGEDAQILDPDEESRPSLIYERSIEVPEAHEEVGFDVEGIALSIV